MRIAFLVGEFPTLSETFILNQVTGLLDLGHEVDIYAMRPSHQTKVHSGVEQYNLLDRTRYIHMPEKMGRYIAGAAPRLIRNLAVDPMQTLRSLNILQFGTFAATLRLMYGVSPFLGRSPLRYDIIHCHFGPHGIYGAKLRKLGVIRGKLITSFHGFGIRWYVQNQTGNPYRRLFSVGDLFTSNSDHTSDRLVELDCPPKRLIKHPEGIDVERFPYIPRSKQRSRPIRLLTVARLVEVKGIEYSIRAIADVVHRQSKRDLLYEVAGEGPLRPELEQLAAKLDVSANVRFLGWTDHAEVRRLYAKADVFLLTGVTASNGSVEAAGVVLMEAQASGLPIIASNIGGIPETVRGGESALLVRERDVNAIAGAIGQLSSDPRARARMGRAGRRHVENHYDIRKLNRRLVELYRDVVADE